MQILPNMIFDLFICVFLLNNSRNREADMKLYYCEMQQFQISVGV